MKLAKREKECLWLIAHGHNTREISTYLFISQHTVRGYIKTMRKKLKCKSIAQAVFKVYGGVQS